MAFPASLIFGRSIVVPLSVQEKANETPSVTYPGQHEAKGKK